MHDFKKGDRISYQSRPGVFEYGVITSINETIAFVRFDGQIGDTNRGCRIEDLIKI